MSLAYVARCKKGKVVAVAIARTPLEQADCAKDVKQWSKSWDVTLEEVTGSLVWCFTSSKKSCKKCEEQNNEPSQ